MSMMSSAVRGTGGTCPRTVPSNDEPALRLEVDADRQLLGADELEHRGVDRAPQPGQARGWACGGGRGGAWWGGRVGGGGGGGGRRGRPPPAGALRAPGGGRPGCF